MNGTTDGEVRFRERVIAAWPGLDDESALDELLGIVLKPGMNEDYPTAMKVLDAMRFPKEVIVTKIMDRAAGIDSYETGLNRVFFLVSYYGDDPRVMAYLVSYINDKRPMGRRERIPGEEYHSAGARICDCSASIIRELLHNRGLLNYGDPGMGQPGGAASHAEADRQLGFLKEVLRRNGLMDAASPGSPPPSRPGGDPENPQPGGREPGEAAASPGVENEMTGVPPAAMAGAALLVALAAGWLAFRKWPGRKP